ncbi:hypothetical protein M501DRAFT_987441 [Patellaria atrata CBS 101060]|uniref:Uncharacterized protein n=1 Tax=Patellaria atrata CBS 101060 TaxID=1346257 RepID=A0A9P4S593_9PEZI|nr:hypothetical protein M501DRAFT_987441 [Patellaria atrata CBS 101060]
MRATFALVAAMAAHALATGVSSVGPIVQISDGQIQNPASTATEYTIIPTYPLTSEVPVVPTTYVTVIPPVYNTTVAPPTTEVVPPPITTEIVVPPVYPNTSIATTTMKTKTTTEVATTTAETGVPETSGPSAPTGGAAMANIAQFGSVAGLAIAVAGLLFA